MESYTLAPVAELRALLDAAGIRNAEDPARLTPPGVLVQVTGFDRDTLAATVVACRLLLVVPAGDYQRSLSALVVLLNRVCEVVDPDGPTTAASLTLPGDATPLPALAVPLNLS